LTFTSPPFQGHVPGITLDCACDTDGSFKNPKFDHSPSRWTCAGSATEAPFPTVTFAIRGAVAGNGKISQVEGLLTQPGVANALWLKAT